VGCRLYPGGRNEKKKDKGKRHLGTIYLRASDLMSESWQGVGDHKNMKKALVHGTKNVETKTGSKSDRAGRTGGR